MKPKKFWKLSFYDWSLWLNAIISDQRKRSQDHELHIRLQREWMAHYTNMKLPQHAEKVNGSDFFELPGDEVDKKETEFKTPQQLEEEMKKRVRKVRTK